MTSLEILNKLNNRTYHNTNFAEMFEFFQLILERNVELENLINEKIDNEQLRLSLAGSGLIDYAAEDE